MTVEGYWAIVRSLGLAQHRKLTPDSMLCLDRDGHPRQVPIPDKFSPEERADLIALLKQRMGVATH